MGSKFGIGGSAMGGSRILRTNRVLSLGSTFSGDRLEVEAIMNSHASNKPKQMAKMMLIMLTPVAALIILSAIGMRDAMKIVRDTQSTAIAVKVGI